MASMNISLPDPMREYVQDRIDSGQYASASDYVRDLIRRDRGAMEDEQRWLRELDTSIVKSLAEMNAGGGIGLEMACDALSSSIKSSVRRDRALRPIDIQFV